MIIITSEMIKKAEEVGACKEELEKARKMVGQELTNPYWAYYYALFEYHNSA